MKEPLIHLLHEDQVIFKSCMKILFTNEFLLCFYLFLLNCAYLLKTSLQVRLFKEFLVCFIKPDVVMGANLKVEETEYFKPRQLVKCRNLASWGEGTVSD